MGSLHRVDFGSRMRTSILVPGVFLLVAAIWRPTRAQTQAQEGCCQQKTVRDAPAEVSELNGLYILKADEGSKPDPNCMDGCVYLRDNEEYCFVQKSTEEGATVVCEAATSPFFTGSSTPPTSPVSGGSTGSTFGGPTGQTGSTPTGSTDGTTGSLDDLTSRANEAHEKKKAAEAAIANAEAAKAAAEDVSNKLNDLDMSKFVSSRFRRQDASTTTTTYPTPANCNDIKSAMTDLTNAMDSSSSEYNTARAVAIVAILSTDITLSPGCSTSDVADLDSAREAAKNKADAVVTEQTNLISTKTDELNALVLEIQSLNEQIAAAGGTTVDPGTTAQPVDTVAAGSTPGSSPGSTPGSSPGSSP